jgi:hypothetical protein
MRWWDNPEASASLLIAIAAGTFSVYQLYQYPAERRRRTLDAMVARYKLSAEERGTVLRELPCLIEVGYVMILSAVTSRITEVEAALDGCTGSEDRWLLEHLHDLRADAERWMPSYLGASFTGAHEILASEFKFRAFMWCIEILRDPEARESIGVSKDLLTVARGAVDKLNDFVLEYENGAYPPRSMLGQLHLSLVLVAKALEPVIWEGKGKEGRWGRRIIRIGIAGQHYNDVNKIHRISSISWQSDTVTELVVHPALSKSVFGKEVIDPRIPYSHRLLPLLRLQARSRYWRFVGTFRWRPRFVWAYGGRRLREHKRAEDKLGPALNFAIANRRDQEVSASINFAWALSSLPRDMNREFKLEQSRTAGRFAWIYTRRTSL